MEKTSERGFILEIYGITVECERKKVKNLNLRILPPDGKVKLSVPIYMKESVIREFVLEKLSWIEHHRRQFSSNPLIEREYVTGEKIFLFGKPITLEVKISDEKRSAVLSGDSLILVIHENDGFAEREKLMCEFYRAELSKKIRMHLPKWEKITGLKSSSWQIKRMRSRWGSCNTQSGNIVFNLELAKRPEVCLEYVILHEVTHLRIRNHGADFKAFLDLYMPNWREIKKLTNDNKFS